MNISDLHADIERLLMIEESTLPQLYPYQEKARQHILTHNRCALFLECGLGKTAITLKALPDLPKPALVIAPKRVIDNTWPTEIAMWYPEAKVVPIIGTPQQRVMKAMWDKAPVDIHLINFELVTWLIENANWRWKTVIIDESTRVKNHSSKLFKALRKVAGHWQHLVELTGTPSPNGLTDLWAQLYLIDKGERLGKTVTAFRDRWFTHNQYTFSYKPLPHSQVEIEGLVSDVCLSMTAEDYLDLPEMIVDEIRVDLPPLVRKNYEQLKKTMVAEIEGEEITAISAAALVNKLLQLTSGCVYDMDGEVVKSHDTKVDVVEDIVNSVGGEPVVIAYQFKHELAQLRQRFPQGKEVRDAKNVVLRWNAGDLPILFLHPASAGHGLNIQYGGRHLIWTTPTWNLEWWIQTNKRLHRNGQTKPVMIYQIITNKSIDERVVQTMGGKNAVQQAFMEAMK